MQADAHWHEPLSHQEFLVCMGSSGSGRWFGNSVRHRSRIALRTLRRQSAARELVALCEHGGHRCFTAAGRVPLRVVGLALHCPQRADSAKLVHVCGSGSSGGHHPSPGTAQPLYAADGHLLPAAYAAGAHSIVTLRISVPGLSMPRVTRALGTRSPPSTSYLAQGAQPQRLGLAVPRSRASGSRGSRQCLTKLESACHCMLSGS